MTIFFINIFLSETLAGLSEVFSPVTKNCVVRRLENSRVVKHITWVFSLATPFPAPSQSAVLQSSYFTSPAMNSLWIQKHLWTQLCAQISASHPPCGVTRCVPKRSQRWKWIKTIQYPVQLYIISELIRYTSLIDPGHPEIYQRFGDSVNLVPELRVLRA